MNKNIQVLIIDDDEKICQMFKTVLNEEGIDTDYALSGHSAVEMVRSNNYNMLFIDMVMPGINGLQTLEQIRTFNSNIPVVMISGYSVAELLETPKKLGIYESIDKPIYISQIMKVINDIVKRQNRGWCGNPAFAKATEDKRDDPLRRTDQKGEGRVL